MPGPGNSARVLIVDDEPPISDTLAVIFRMSGYEVRVAYTAEQAIETIAAWKPDLALLDVMLPGMNGIELAVVVKENYPDCHVLLFSGHAGTGALLEEAAGRGHRFEILAKPMHPADVLATVKTLLATVPRSGSSQRRLS